MEEFITLSILKANYPYIITFIMYLVGFYIMLIETNLVKKVIGLNIFQGAIILFYIIVAKIDQGIPPIYDTNNPNLILSNPLPHVLMLTAIVVGIATTAVAFSLIYVIYVKYGTINEKEIIEINKGLTKHNQDNNYSTKNITDTN